MKREHGSTTNVYEADKRRKRFSTEVSKEIVFQQNIKILNQIEAEVREMEKTLNETS